MLSIISLICAALGYILFFFTDMLTFPIILIVAGFVVALVELIPLYQKDKLPLREFIKEALNTSWGSIIGVLAGVNFAWLIFIFS